jgi:hypothetical protein
MKSSCGRRQKKNAIIAGGDGLERQLYAAMNSEALFSGKY